MLFDRYYGHVDYRYHNARRYTYGSDLNGITTLANHIQTMDWNYKGLKYVVSYSLAKYTMLSHEDVRCYAHVHMNAVGHGVLLYIHVCSTIKLLTYSQNRRYFLLCSTYTRNGYNAIAIPTRFESGLV